MKNKSNSTEIKPLSYYPMYPNKITIPELKEYFISIKSSETLTNNEDFGQSK